MLGFWEKDLRRGGGGKGADTSPCLDLDWWKYISAFGAAELSDILGPTDCEDLSCPFHFCVQWLPSLDFHGQISKAKKEKALPCCSSLLFSFHLSWKKGQNGAALCGGWGERTRAKLACLSPSSAGLSAVIPMMEVKVCAPTA